MGGVISLQRAAVRLRQSLLNPSPARGAPELHRHFHLAVAAEDSHPHGLAGFLPFEGDQEAAAGGHRLAVDAEDDVPQLQRPKAARRMPCEPAFAAPVPRSTR